MKLRAGGGGVKKPGVRLFLYDRVRSCSSSSSSSSSSSEEEEDLLFAFRSAFTLCVRREMLVSPEELLSSYMSVLIRVTSPSAGHDGKQTEKTQT